MSGREFFALDYTAVLDAAFIAMTAAFAFWKWRSSGLAGHGGTALSERILFGLAMAAFAWLAAGLLLPVSVI